MATAAHHTIQIVIIQAEVLFYHCAARFPGRPNEEGLSNAGGQVVITTGELVRGTQLPDIVAFELHCHFEVIRWRPNCGSAKSGVFLGAPLPTRDLVCVTGIAEFVPTTGDPNTQVVSQRPAHCKLCVVFFIVTSTYHDIAFKGIPRPSADVIQDARGSTLAGEGRLGSAHDLYPFQIEK